MKKFKLLETIYAGCKINLGLKITGIREDGYHTLDSIFWPLSSPCDRLDFYLGNTKGFTVSCDTEGIDVQKNTLTKAYAAFIQAGGELPQKLEALHVHLHKGIAHGAGLGGGSSDAAAVLLWLNEQAVKPLTSEQLRFVALSVGADVVFFLANIPARVQGIGEIITPLEKSVCDKFSGKTLLLLCPNINISTPWAFTAYDEKLQNDFFKKNRKNLLTKIESNDRNNFSCADKEDLEFNLENNFDSNDFKLENDLESVVFAAWTQLAALKHKLLNHGASIALMSGSGSSVFGLMPNKEIAESFTKMLVKSSQDCSKDDLNIAQCRVFIATL